MSYHSPFWVFGVALCHESSFIAFDFAITCVFLVFHLDFILEGSVYKFINSISEWSCFLSFGLLLDYLFLRLYLIGSFFIFRRYDVLIASCYFIGLFCFARVNHILRSGLTENLI